MIWVAATAGVIMLAALGVVIYAPPTEYGHAAVTDGDDNEDWSCPE